MLITEAKEMIEYIRKKLNGESQTDEGFLIVNKDGVLLFDKKEKFIGGICKPKFFQRKL